MIAGVDIPESKRILVPRVRVAVWLKDEQGGGSETRGFFVSAYKRTGLPSGLALLIR
jgi:hypothetical protein